MDLADVNVLVYALRDEVDDHLRYRAWVMDMANGATRFAYNDALLASFIRVATLPVWRPQTPIDTALRFCDLLRNRPNALRIEAGPGSWEAFAGLCRDTPACGNLAADAWIAALALEHGCTVVTCDADFARFSGVRWRHPLQAAPKG
jgi:toxin-antitoxin system PIN domain toxin